MFCFNYVIIAQNDTMTVTEENLLRTGSKTEATSDHKSTTSSLETKSAATLKGIEQKPKNLRSTKMLKNVY